ncbi:hypothetical protein ABB37_03818 [Leptomonas pyrrhocoris]|uniref:Amastin-like surface protein-like protein n=1 Tax=Leptomonas pyrrhocoris TaxID=157538 RepID=A0A0M9G389_LEPPY|nr:hypothetical protein ABB37_03818 [Leptomonas pyrrhocoris]XP_015659894.1 hypothetical protein ABB37_03818 [Leptomonas pyrrhocoris]KPA81454.1 hypothetical protein ABB37_03818 [Leptomonas pyrrhocoris]KPA81455.1 hypothetical protein ABB37_03818 [Leptomonas pyrrhocoris]|eukprot:XP_015659893.1 hypothetical protein ABB37_03818 [Leptomonas pyrrhocoris]
MLFVRFLVLVLILIFDVLALVGTLTLPIFSAKVSAYGLENGKVQVSLWEIHMSKMSLTGVNETEVPSSQPVRINYAGCSSFRATFRAMEAFAIAGTVFGFYAFLISCLQCFCRLKVKLPLFLFMLLAFISEAALVIIGGVAYGTVFCSKMSTESNLTSVVFKGAGYKLDTGYIIQIVAAVGYLITFLITPFTQQLWCGNC